VLIPLRHENMRGRRWPIITFALIGLNVPIFLLTHGPIEDQQTKRAEVRLHLLVLAASHPELHLTDEATAFVESIKKKAGPQWDKLASKGGPLHDPWSSQLRQTQDPAELQEQMDSLCADFDAERSHDILDKYAFVPAHPTALSCLTANFLHGGWIHLLGNMWFLWLAGFILEGTWGRVLYSIFSSGHRAALPMAPEGARPDNAWHAFKEYTTAAGDKLRAATWLEICRVLETQQNFERAASEYERLA
jgi:hypothetical protein